MCAARRIDIKMLNTVVAAVVPFFDCVLCECLGAHCAHPIHTLYRPIKEVSNWNANSLYCALVVRLDYKYSNSMA